MQEGVFGTSTLVTAGGVSNVAAADFLVSQRAAGANLSVDINMPGGGFAWVQGDTISGQGLYVVPVAAANINEAIGTADATNPRVDQVILEVLDNVLDASGSNKARTRVVPGTPTNGATLANRSGAAALPGSALLLADVLVGNGVSTLANAVIRDRRKWARGAFVQITRSANAAAGSNYTTTSASFVELDTTNLKPRVECSGTPMRATFNTSFEDASATASWADLWLDGVSANRQRPISIAAGGDDPISIVFDISPAAGSHLFSPAWKTSAGTLIAYAQATSVLTFTVEEIVKANAANNTVTTG